MSHPFRRYLLSALSCAAALLLAAAVYATPTAPPAATARAALHVIPTSDGTGITVAAGRIGNLTTPIHSTLQVGGTSYEPGHTSYEPGHTPGDGHWVFTFEGVTQRLTSPAMTVVVTTTDGTTGTVTLGSSDFERRYVPGDVALDAASLDNELRLHVPASALPTDAYLVIMDTFAPPGDPPPGHRLLGQVYSIRASHVTTESRLPMLLSMDYEFATLGGADPRTVSVFRWDEATDQWLDLVSTPFGAETTHVKSISRFGAYILMAGTTWRDPFRDYQAVAEREHVRLVSGGRITLANGEDEGWIISVPITPTDGFARWDKLHYAGEVPSGASLTVDVLAEDKTILLHDVADGADLAGIDPVQYPSLQLCATLRHTQPEAVPYLDEWTISWQPTAPRLTQRLHLPLITTDSTPRATTTDRAPDLRRQSLFGPPAWNRAGLTGQDISALSVASDNNNVVYTAVSSMAGWGIHKTTDGGAHWAAVYDRLTCYSVATDPQHPLTVYGGEMAYIWKTVNGGQTWTQVANFGVDEAKVLRVDPRDAGRVYAGATNYTNTGSGGVYRSINGGATWQHFLTRQNVHDLVLHPTDPMTLFAATSDFSENSGGIFKSTDGGNTWTRTFTHSHVSAIAVDPFAGSVIYGGTDGDGVVKSTDGGRSWQPANVGLAHPIVKVLAADPVHQGVLFAGTWEGGVYRSNDGALSWEPFNTGLDSTFIMSLAIDAEGRTLYAGTQNNGVYRRALLPPPPPPGSTYATVVDASERPVEGATVWQNGVPVTDTLGQPATTDAAGNLILHDIKPGDRLVAMQLLHEEPTVRRFHDGWAYRVFNTSLRVNADSSVSGHEVVASGQQTLTVTAPLVLFNLVFSLQWNATPEYLEEISRSVRLASDNLYDVSDGAMAFGRVAIYDNAQNWADADVQVLARNTVRPYAYIGGIVSADVADVIRVGRQWDRRAGPGAWDQPDGYRTLIHEFGHYALHLYDSYFKYEYEPQTGYLIGVTDAGIGCTRFHGDYEDDEDDSPSASIMNWQYATTELADRRVSELWDAVQCPDTAQWQVTGQSDRETLEAFYSDRSIPARWWLARPNGNHILPGPALLPPDLLAFPQITSYGDERSAPLHQLLVLGVNGQPYANGALVSLDTLRRGSQVTIDQGITAVPTGTLTVYGASIGNMVRAVSLDGALSGAVPVGARTDLTLRLGPGSSALAASIPLNPYATLIPGDDVHDLTLVVMGAGADAGLSAVVVPPGGGLGQTIDLGGSPGGDAYVGTATFPVLDAGLGSVYVRGVGGLGQHIMVDSDFNLAPADATAEQDFYSPDGKAWWHVDAHSFASANTHVLLMPTGAVPAPLPVNLTPVGNAYSIQASGALTITHRSGVLRLFYDPAALAPAVAPSDLQLARWDGVAWRTLPSQPDPDRFAVAAQTDRLGIYVLLAPVAAENRRVYLPVLLR
jgi:photosystem II stability/assembly factor-like uncharacterized protein